MLTSNTSGSKRREQIFRAIKQARLSFLGLIVCGALKRQNLAAQGMKVMTKRGLFGKANRGRLRTREEMAHISAIEISRRHHPLEQTLSLRNV